MIQDLRRQLGSLYWHARSLVLRHRVVRWLRQVTDPLWVARRCLRQEIRGQAHQAHGLVLDVGCGGRPYRTIFHHVHRSIGVDLPPVAGVDAYADARHLPFAPGTFDTILCFQVLEHVPEPDRVLREAARLLRPGGVLLLTTPQVWGLHHEPHDFFRYTQYGLRHLAAASGLEPESVTPTCGLWATLAQRVADTVVHTYASCWRPWSRRILQVGVWPILSLGFLMDRIAGKRGDTLDNLLVARKPAAIASLTARTKGPGHAIAA